MKQKLAAPLLLAMALAGGQAYAEQHDVLAFPGGQQPSLETRTVSMAGATHTVRYRVWRHLVYVAHPVSTDYQSLDVSMPVEIDGHAVNAGRAPIMLDIRVGGYRSVDNSGKARMGPPPGGGFPSGPQGGNRPPMPPADRAQGPAGEQPAGGPPPMAMGGPQGAGGPPPMNAGGPQGGPPPMHGRPGMRPGMGGNGDKVGMALAAGYVVVSPGVRGWDNKAADGTYFGKAPAAIVDLKAAVRYIRHNAGRLPGNPEWIVSVGCSAGGALSALLGASGNSPLYAEELKAAGAADAPDNIFASACYSPITDLEHADMSYEWMYGRLSLRGAPVDQKLSTALAADNLAYQNALGLTGRNGFGPVTGARLGDYMLQAYVEPSATRALARMAPAARSQYLKQHAWVHWDGKRASFAFTDYVRQIGRMKGVPAFDDLTLQAPETHLFGDARTDARHFTEFSLRQATGKPAARLDAALAERVNMMNPMYFIRSANPGVAPHWWLRNGSHDSNNAESVMINLATALENRSKDVDAALFWEGGHCADDDPQGMIAWVRKLTGYRMASGPGKR